MQPLIEKALDKFAREHGAAEHIDNARHLSIEPFGGNVFRINDMSAGFARPLFAKTEDGKVAPALITMSMLQGMKAKRDEDTAKNIEQMKQQNLADRINSAHDLLDARQHALEKSVLGGAFHAAQQKKIDEERAKLPARMEPPKPLFDFQQSIDPTF